MTIIGYITSIVAAALYTLRYSTVKDLKIHKISKNQLNLYTRLFSIPFLLLIIYLTGESVTAFKEGFFFWITITVLVHTAYNIYLVHTFQKHDFSFVMTLEPIKIFFSLSLGYFFLGEVLKTNQLIGLLIIVLAMSVLLISDKSVKLKNISLWEVLFYHMATASLGLVNKKAILLSNSMAFTLWTAVGLAAAHFILSLGRNKQYKLNNKSTNLSLVYLGLLSALSFSALNFGLAILPIAIVSTLISTRVFMSLWISHKKYKEKNLGLKAVVSLGAFVGILVLFFA